MHTEGYVRGEVERHAAAEREPGRIAERRADVMDRDLLTGRRVSAEEAERIGLVAGVVEADGLMARALEAAEEIAAWSPWGIRLTKQGMWSALEVPAEQAAIEYEDRQQIMGLHGKAPAEAVAAFLEKRPADFTD